MKLFNLFKSVVILMMFALLGISLINVNNDPEKERVFIWLIAESGSLGAVCAIGAIFILWMKQAEGFSKKLTCLMVISNIIIPGLWGLGSHYSQIHFHADVDLSARLVRLLIGFFMGWFSVLLVMYIAQTIRKASKEDDEEDIVPKRNFPSLSHLKQKEPKEEPEDSEESETTEEQQV